MNSTGSGFYASSAIRELEAAAASAGLPESALMQRAAGAAWRELCRHWPKARRLAVVCGPGHNGGDGYVLAGMARAAGWEVLTVDIAGGRGLSSWAQQWRDNGGRHGTLAALSQVEVVVDAVFGIGLRRPVEGEAEAAIAAMNAAALQGAGLLALDVPSGLDADTGQLRGVAAVHARHTVTFLADKPGLHMGQGPDCSGTVCVDDLELPAACFDGIAAAAESLGPDCLQAALPQRARTAHKGRHGKVLLVGGDLGMPGAVLLAGRAALRAGAGLVSVATRAAHAPALAAAQPELMVHAVETPAELQRLCASAAVIAAGPGLGRGRWGEGLWAVLSGLDKPMVVDADALNWLADNPQRREDWVLTPHPGEAARLLGVDTQAVQLDRFATAARLQQQFGGVVVLKGAGTVVQGKLRGLCRHGNPGMGTGGMGDLLTGLVAGLWAQGVTGEQAARCGVVAHALAGDLAAQSGERGLLPSDLLQPMRQLLNP